MTVASYLKRLLGDSAIYGAAGIILKAVAVILIPVYTRVFSPAEFGVLVLLTALLGLVRMFVILGLDNSTARWYYESNEQADQQATVASWFWCQLTVSTVVALFVATVASSISHLLFETAQYSDLIRLAAMTLPFGGIATLFHKFSRYRRKPLLAGGFGISNSIILVTLTILLVVTMRRGLRGVFEAQLISAVLSAGGAVVCLRGWVMPWAVSWIRLKAMLRFGLPLIPAAVAFWVMTASDRLLLKYLSSGEEVGLYGVAASLSAGVTLVVQAFTQAWGPFAFSIWKEGESKAVFARVLELYTFLCCFLCTGLALFSPLLLEILTTEAYFAAASCIAALAFAQGFEGARFIVGIGSGIVKKSAPMAVSIAVGAVINVCLNLLLIPPFGRNGAAVATLAGYASAVVCLYLSSQRDFHIPYRWRKCLACLVFSGAIIAVDLSFLRGIGVTGDGVRVMLLALFVPFGIGLRVIRWNQLRHGAARAPS